MACATCNKDDGACGCISNVKELDLGSQVIWTLGGNAPGEVAIFFGPDDGLPISPTIANLQGVLIVANASSGFKAIAGFELSGDRVTWDAFVPFTAATYQAGNGTLAYAWNSATTNYKRYIRFVVKAQQDAGVNVIAIGRVQLIVNVLVR